MAEYLSQGSVINDLIRECFLLNRCTVEAAQQLTAGTGITGAQWGVLSALAQGEEARSVAETARRMQLARQSVQRVADVLAELGYVEYLPDPADRRTKLARVTPAGQRLLSKLEQRQLDFAGQIAGLGSARDVRAAIRLVHSVHAGMRAQLGVAEDGTPPQAATG